MTEAELFQHLRAGDNKAFEMAYKKGFPLIYNLVTYNNGTKTDAQDIMQDVIFSLVKNLRKPDFKLTCQLTTYLYSVGRNLWLMKLRKAGISLSEIQDQPFVSIDDSEIERKQIQEEKYQIVAEVLNQLGENCRKLIMAFYYKKMAMKDIASLLGIAPASMKVTKHRCMKELKKKVSQHTAYQALNT